MPSIMELSTLTLGLYADAETQKGYLLTTLVLTTLAPEDHGS